MDERRISEAARVTISALPDGTGERMYLNEPDACNNCVFAGWDDCYVCQRFPPSRFGGEPIGTFPIVGEWAWCGEFKRRYDWLDLPGHGLVSQIQTEDGPRWGTSAYPVNGGGRVDLRTYGLSRPDSLRE